MGKMIKKSLALLLVLVMTVSLAGCKKETGEETPTGNVYVPTFSEIDCDIQWINQVFSNGDVITFMGEDFDYETYESTRVKIDYNLVTGEQTKTEFESEDNSYYTSIQPTETGYYAVVESYVEPTEEELESGYYDYSANFSFVEMDLEFNIINEISLDDLADKVTEEMGWFYVSNFAVDAEKNIYICGDENIWVLDSTGKQLYEITPPNWVQAMTSTEDGQIIVFYSNEEYETVASVLNTQTRELGEELQNLPGASYYGNSIYKAGGSKLYMNSDTSLYIYDVATQTSEEILNWIDCDINTNNLNGFTVLSDGSFVAVTTQYNYSEETQTSSTTIELATIKEVPAASVVQKKVITLAMLYMDYELKEDIIKFNKTNEEYRIKVKTYVDDSYSNYEDAITQFNTEIATGSMADIIIIPAYESIDYANLAAKGVFADLNEFFENDPEIKKDDFITNVFDTLSIDGKLYGIADSFSILSLVGKTEDVGDGDSWTFADVKALMEKHPDAMLMDYITKEYAIQFLTRYSMDSFYNVETGECSFNSQEFIDVLELANSFPTEYNWDEDTYESQPSKLRSGKVLLCDVYIYSFDEYQLYEGLYNADVNYIGYPTASGSGSVAQFNDIMTISAKSKNKDGAWEFIRQFITPEAQEDIQWEIPVNKQCFEDLLTEAMNNENEGSWYYDDVEVKMGKLTEEDAQNIRDLVYGITSSASYNEEMYNIILEDAKAYFEGDKSAQEVADIIQSRVQLYVDENR